MFDVIIYSVLEEHKKILNLFEYMRQGDVARFWTKQVFLLRMFVLYTILLSVVTNPSLK